MALPYENATSGNRALDDIVSDAKELARLVQDFIDANYPFHQRTLILELAKEVDRGA